MNVDGTGNIIPRFTLFFIRMLIDQLVRLIRRNSIRLVSAIVHLASTGQSGQKIWLIFVNRNGLAYSRIFLAPPFILYILPMIFRGAHFCV